MAGAIAGIAGSLISSVAGGALSGALGGLMSSVTSLAGQFGSDMVGDAIGNLVNGKFGEALKGLVNSLPMPQFAKDMIGGVIDNAMEGAKKDVSPECQCAVDGNDAINEAADSQVDQMMKNVQSGVEEAKEEQKKEGGEGQNWFTVLAKALGNTAGKHLDKMVELQDKMSGLTDKEDAGEMAEVQAEFQAQSQMFKLASEATSTAVKSIGEGLSSLARKQ